MFRFILLCLTIIILSQTNHFSQEPPIKWEEIPIDQLKMDSFPSDSNASAVILCDYGESRFNDELEIIFTRHLRIKILNENGYDWGTHSIYLYTGKHGERLKDLEAITYSLDSNGKIVKNELDDDDIFEEEVTDEKTKYNFTMPALQPGCIVDIRYKIISESIWLIKGWTFQKDEPVLWSEYRLLYPKNISFTAVTIGYEPWEINDLSETKQHFGGLAQSLMGPMVDCNNYRLAVKNVPALRDEPYITTIDDYKNRLDIQLSGYVFITTGLKRVLTDWKTLSNDLLDNNYFGDMIDPDEVEDIAINITKGLRSQEEKMQAIYNWITKSIVWSGEKRVFAENDLDEVIEYKKGNTAEITFLLISMLKNVGIKAEPVILSTRSNGLLQELYPIISQFNYVLARVIIGSKTYYIDATDPLRPLDMLPEEVLNVKGLVLIEDKPQWAILTSQLSNIDKAVINVQLNEDGFITGEIEEKLGDYKSLTSRKDFSGLTDMEGVNEFYKTEAGNFSIDSALILNKDSLNQPLKIKMNFSSENYSQIGGNLIYYNPNLFHRLTDNPFKSSERKFPIDFGYPWGWTTITNIKIPEGYELKEDYLNKSVNISDIATFQRIINLNEGLVQIMNRVEIKKSVVKSNYYHRLKEFFAQIITTQSEMLVFGPKENPEGVSVNVNDSK